MTFLAHRILKVLTFVLYHRASVAVHGTFPNWTSVSCWRLNATRTRPLALNLGDPVERSQGA